MSVAVLCKCGCGREVPEGRDLYATLACNQRMQHRRWKARQLRVDPAAAARVQAASSALGVAPNELLARLLGESLERLEASLRAVAWPAAEAVARPARPAEPRITAYDVLLAVSTEFGVSVEELRGRDRTARVTGPRAAVAWLCRLSGHTLSTIGAALDGRDHQTVYWALGRCATRLADAAYATQVKRAADALGLEWPL